MPGSKGEYSSDESRKRTETSDNQTSRKSQRLKPKVTLFESRETKLLKDTSFQVEYKDTDEEPIMTDHETSDNETEDSKQEKKDQESQLANSFSAQTEEDEAIENEDDYPKGNLYFRRLCK